MKLLWSIKEDNTIRCHINLENGTLRKLALTASTAARS